MIFGIQLNPAPPYLLAEHFFIRSIIFKEEPDAESGSYAVRLVQDFLDDYRRPSNREKRAPLRR